MRNVDLFVSRRDLFVECEYWLRDTNSDPNELIYKSRNPNGTFDAKIPDTETLGKQILGGVFMFDTTNLMLETTDDIHMLKENDVVRYQNNFYMVEQIQKVAIRRNAQFFDDVQYKYYLSLRG
jgi:hypothetical protein